MVPSFTVVVGLTSTVGHCVVVTAGGVAPKWSDCCFYFLVIPQEYCLDIVHARIPAKCHNITFCCCGDLDCRFSEWSSSMHIDSCHLNYVLSAGG